MLKSRTRIPVQRSREALPDGPDSPGIDSRPARRFKMRFPFPPVIDGPSGPRFHPARIR